MASDDRKGKGSKDVDDLKARLGLKVPKRAPAIAAPPPEVAPPPEPEPEPEATVANASTLTAPPTYAPEPTQAAQRHTGNHAAYVPPPSYVDDTPPPPKSAWDRYGRALVIAAVVAAAGGTVGYLFGKGAAIKSGYGKVKEDAIKIDAIIKAGYAKVEEAAAALDPSYARAKKEGKEPPAVRGLLRKDVDWPGVDALEKIETPKDLESIFETDYKRFNRLTVKYLTSFFLDMSRLAQGAREHAAATKTARAQLEAEAKEGAGPRAFGVLTQAVANGPPRGEIVLLRGRRIVKQGEAEGAVFDIARRSAPAQVFTVPEQGLIILSAPGLLKTSGSLLEEYNRRSRELAEIVRRLLEVRPRITSSIEQIIQQIKG